MAKGFRGSAPGEVRNTTGRGTIRPGEVRNPAGRNQMQTVAARKAFDKRVAANVAQAQEEHKAFLAQQEGSRDTPGDSVALDTIDDAGGRRRATEGVQEDGQGSLARPAGRKSHLWTPETVPRPPPGSHVGNKAAAYRAAIVNSIPPARIAYYLERAALLAEDHRSWRGMLAVAEVALQYGVGKPRAMESEGGSVDLGALLATIAGLAEREGVAGETTDGDDA